MKKTRNNKAKKIKKRSRKARGLVNFFIKKTKGYKTVNNFLNKDYYKDSEITLQKELKINPDLKRMLDKDGSYFIANKIKPLRNIANKQSFINENCKNYPTKKFKKHDALERLINDIKQYVDNKTKKFNNILIPYSVEELKFFSGYDVVNTHSLDMESFKIINKNLNMDLDLETFKKYFTITNKEISTTHNQIKFLEFLLENVSNNKLGKATFIVSHSNFMTKFTNLLLEIINPEFFQSVKSKKAKKIVSYNNLDILHIGFKDNSIEVLNIYREDEIYENKQNVVTDPEIKHVFIMRHCFACHNTSSSLSQKSFNHDSGYYSKCLPQYIVPSLNRGKDKIIKIFNNYGIDLSDIKFGSSLIFRAFITCYFLQNALINNLNNNNYESDDEASPTGRNSKTSKLRSSSIRSSSRRSPSRRLSSRLSKTGRYSSVNVYN